MGFAGSESGPRGAVGLALAEADGLTGGGESLGGVGFVEAAAADDLADAKGHAVEGVVAGAYRGPAKAVELTC